MSEEKTEKMRDPQLSQEVEKFLRECNNKSAFLDACSKKLGEGVVKEVHWEEEPNPKKRIVLINIPEREQPATIHVLI